MANWKVTPSDGVTGSNGKYNFPKNTGDTPINYTISYTGDNGCTAIISYPIPNCPPAEVVYENYYFCMYEIGEGTRTVKRLSRSYSFDFSGVGVGNLQFDQLFGSNDTTPNCSSGIQVFPQTSLGDVKLNGSSIDYLTQFGQQNDVTVPYLTNLILRRTNVNTAHIIYTVNNNVVFNISTNGMVYTNPTGNINSSLAQNLDIIWYFKVDGVKSDLYYNFHATF